jgi:hypothetical protein
MHGSSHATVAADSRVRKVSPEVGVGPAALNHKPAAAPVQRNLFRLAIPVALALVIVAVIASYLWRGKKQTELSPPGSSSIAVLPFADLSAAQDQRCLNYVLT